MKRFRGAFLVLLVVGFLSSPTTVQADGGGCTPPYFETGNCEYCAYPRCNCDCPPPGYYLIYSCSCMGWYSCERSCVYEPL
jgi:hypothetical protein